MPQPVAWRAVGKAIEQQQSLYARFKAGQVEGVISRRTYSTHHEARCARVRADQRHGRLQFFMPAFRRGLPGHGAVTEPRLVVAEYRETGSRNGTCKFHRTAVWPYAVHHAGI